MPAGPASGAKVDVVVNNPDGQSPLVAADRYTYALPGYWLVASDGGIFAYGKAGFFGSTGGMHLNQPVVGMAATPDDRGYWLVASDGGIFAYGDAGFYGSTGGHRTSTSRWSGMAATPDGGGYWLVASDGGIFAYGDAGFYGSTGGHAPQPAGRRAWPPPPTAHGYWLVASDGGIFAYGDADFYGSTGGHAPQPPVVGHGRHPRRARLLAGGLRRRHLQLRRRRLLRLDRRHAPQPARSWAWRPSLTGAGYWLVASDGGIFSYGDANFFGSTGGMRLNDPVVGMAAT